MIEGAALVYGLLASFVLTSTRRNVAAARRHPAMMVYVGLALMGGSFAMAALLLFKAVRMYLGF